MKQLKKKTKLTYKLALSSTPLTKRWRSMPFLLAKRQH